MLEVYDCDFNQQLGMQWKDGSPLFLWDIDPKRLEDRPIALGKHFSDAQPVVVPPAAAGLIHASRRKSHAQADSIDTFRFVLIASARGIDFECAPYFVPDAAKHRDLFFFRSRRMSGIIKTPMVSVHLAGKHRASLVRVSTDGDDGFDVLTKKLDQVFGPVT